MNETLQNKADQEKPADSRYIAVNIGHNLFLISAETVTEMMEKPPINKIPMMPDSILGVANVRGTVVPVYDARVRLGKGSFEKERDELITNLKQREQDHRNWLKELSACVNEDRQFTLATDPHKCKFGKWYDSFKSDDMELTKILREFDEPHQRIHALAHQAEDRIKDNKREKAKDLIENTGKSTLGLMIDIFGRMFESLKDHDKRILMVLNYKNKKTGMLIDSADNVVKIENSDISVSDAGSDKQHKFVKLQDGLMAELIDPSEIFF